MLVLCDFARLGTPDAVYDYLSEELQLPPYFGRNLDALHDTIHEMARDEARHGKAFKGLLERYFG